MKKSKFVNLVLITAALASADKIEAQSGSASGDWDKQPEKKVYMRSTQPRVIPERTTVV
jgi:hypothetical protein